MAGRDHGCTEHDMSANRFLAQQIQHVGNECHVTPPRDLATDISVFQFVANRAGCDRRAGVNRRLHHGRVETQDALAVRRGAFGEEYDRYTIFQNLTHTCIRTRRVAAIMASDEDAA